MRLDCRVRQELKMMITSDEFRRKRLEHTEKPVRVVLDTDTKNEIDDQFAIVYALFSPIDITVEAINAAPFTKTGYLNPALGMEASYQEILKVLDKMDIIGKVPVFRGARSILRDPAIPIRSEATDNLIRLAAESGDDPLYVVGIGAATNIASAILLKPEIMKHIVVVWLGSHPEYWDTPIEFNLQNDPMAAMILLDSGVPLVHVPCKNVAEHLRTVPVEIDEYVRGRGAIGDYLADIFREWVPGRARSKPLWDMTTIAYLVNPEWVPSKISQAPKINADMTWGTIEKGRHIYRVAIDAKRDPIFQDFFGKLEGGISC
jgi:inosine-uridine nucleoside N-ribohydrolase